MGDQDGFADDFEVAVEFYPRDEAAETLVETAFPNAETMRSKSFTGEDAVILVASLRLLKNVLDFIAAERERYTKIEVVFEEERVSVKGLPMDDLQKLIELPSARQMIQELRKA